MQISWNQLNREAVEETKCTTVHTMHQCAISSCIVRSFSALFTIRINFRPVSVVFTASATAGCATASTLYYYYYCFALALIEVLHRKIILLFGMLRTHRALARAPASFGTRFK